MTVPSAKVEISPHPVSKPARTEKSTPRVSMASALMNATFTMEMVPADVRRTRASNGSAVTMAWALSLRNTSLKE